MDINEKRNEVRKLLSEYYNTFEPEPSKYTHDLASLKKILVMLRVNLSQFARLIKGNDSYDRAYKILKGYQMKISESEKDTILLTLKKLIDSADSFNEVITLDKEDVFLRYYNKEVTKRNARKELRMDWGNFEILYDKWRKEYEKQRQ